MIDKELVLCYDPPDGPEYTGPTRTIRVTAYRTIRTVRSADFLIPETYTDQQITAYLEDTFAYLGLYEIFDQDRFVTETRTFDVLHDDDPETGYTWTELDASDEQEHLSR